MRRGGCDLWPDGMREPNEPHGTCACGLRRRVGGNHPAWNPCPCQRSDANEVTAAQHSRTYWSVARGPTVRRSVSA